MQEEGRVDIEKCSGITGDAFFKGLKSRRVLNKVERKKEKAI